MITETGQVLDQHTTVLRQLVREPAGPDSTQKNR
jgi:hypothetical protein